jgi:hypothetical protein
MTDEEGISKQAFAEVMEVSPGRVSQWLAAGQIDSDALVGSGRSARIRPAIAREQLRTRLDVGHRVRANAKAQLDPLIPFAAAPAESPAAAPRTIVSDIEQQIQAERLEGFRRDNRRKAEEEAARSGRYVRASDASKWFGKSAAMLINLFEGFLGQLASTLSAKFGLAQRDVLHVLRSEFRVFRASASAALRREADQLPIMVEDDPNQDHAIGGDELTIEPAKSAENETGNDNGN